MKSYLRCLLFTTVFLASIGLGCTKNSPGIPLLGNYFTFADPNRIARIGKDDFIAERVDLNDSTRVSAAQRMSSQYFVTRFNSQPHSLIFELNSGPIFKPGLNQICRVRFRYEGLPGVEDWLEFRNTAEEWINPTDVKFNGKPVARLTSNEPVRNSYLYVLP